MEDRAVTAVVDDDVESRLFGDPTAFSFFQAVRLLERMHPERAPVGAFTEPGSEAVTFTANPSVAFPASEIQSLERAGSGAPSMEVNFFGLIGPQGVLPYWYSLLVQEQKRDRRASLRAFLDIFQHRILSQFYRAWAKSRGFVNYEIGRDDRATHLLRALLGLRRGADQRPAAGDALLYYAGLFGAHRRSAIALEQLLADYFDVQASVEQFVGGWFPVPEASLCRIGAAEDDTTALGVGSVVGDEVWDPQVRVRIRLGPLARAQYDSFLPGGDAHGELRALARSFSDGEVDFELRLVLRREDVPPCRLGAEDGGTQLGWTTWIRTAPFTHDADNATLTL